MESLGRKLEQLSGEQRREVEDFIDFLLSRTRDGPARGGSDPVPAPYQQDPLPPLILPEPVARLETGLPCTGAEGEGNPAGPEPAFREIARGGPGRSSGEYMDYGKFEVPPSPATEAVEKVKRRIIARESRDRPRDILDWVD